MKKTAFITGICGQDGAYLAELLLSKGYSVFGGVKRSSHDQFWRLRSLGIEDKIKFLNFDLTDSFSIFDLINKHRFSEVYNLGAQSFVGASWDAPTQTCQVNSMGVLSLLDAIRRFSPESRFYQASTSEMFGLIQDSIQTEKTPLYPRSPYGVSKVFSHYMTINYRESFDLFACSGILFNHESPLRGIEFVTKKITSGFAEIANGRDSALRLGNVDSERDWGFAGEYVDGMWRMLNADIADDYVLATGRKVSVRYFLECAAAVCGFDLEWQGEGVNERAIDQNTGKCIVSIDEQFYRPAEVDVLIGDAGKAKRVLDWAPKCTVESLAEMMMRFDLDNSL